MARFKIVTPKGATAGKYDLENEALAAIDAAIVEAPADEAGFIAAAKNADAIYAKGIRITKSIIDALDSCKVISLPSVGVDTVDVKAASARGIPVTNVPDTFIEEVADHAMALLLAGFRRVIEQDKMVREGRWSEAAGAVENSAAGRADARLHLVRSCGARGGEAGRAVRPADDGL
ncbi:MAG: hypothetical protein R3D69_13820 [Xanthobacteraceae bacterium]